MFTTCSPCQLVVGIVVLTVVGCGPSDARQQETAWAELTEWLPEEITRIEKRVAQRNDTYTWSHHRLKSYQTALDHLEHRGPPALQEPMVIHAVILGRGKERPSVVQHSSADYVLLLNWTEIGPTQIVGFYVLMDDGTSHDFQVINPTHEEMRLYDDNPGKYTGVLVYEQETPEQKSLNSKGSDYVVLAGEPSGGA